MEKKEKVARHCKERMVEEVLSHLKGHPNFFITNFIGSSVSDLEQLRRSLNKISSEYVVVKNSIFKIVLNKLKLDEMAPMVDGAVGISLSGDDVVTTCRVLVNFTKDHGAFKIKAGFLEGKGVRPERVKEIALIPAKDILIARLLTGMKSPINGFANVLGGILRKFVYAVDAIRAKKPSFDHAQDGSASVSEAKPE